MMIRWLLAVHGREIFWFLIGGIWTLLVMMGTRIMAGLQWRATITHHMPAIYRAELAARDGRIEVLERDLKVASRQLRERCETIYAIRAVVKNGKGEA